MNTKYTDSRGHVRWPKQEKQELLARFENVEMTASEFARQQGINPKTFSRWVREARQESSEAGGITFRRVEVAVTEKCAVRRVEVLLPNDMRVLVPMGSMEELGAVLREVAQC